MTVEKLITEQMLITADVTEAFIWGLSKESEGGEITYSNVKGKIVGLSTKPFTARIYDEEDGEI